MGDIKFDKLFNLKRYKIQLPFYIWEPRPALNPALPVPGFMVDFGFENKKDLSLYAFIYQYQNEKYLAGASKKNTLKSPDEYENFMASDNKTQYLEINNLIKEEFSICLFSELTNNLISPIG